MTDHETERLARICRQALDALDAGFITVAVEILEQERRRRECTEPYPLRSVKKTAHTFEHNAREQGT
jgi:hypothetical protein